MLDDSQQKQADDSDHGEAVVFARENFFTGRDGEILRGFRNQNIRLH